MNLGLRLVGVHMAARNWGIGKFDELTVDLDGLSPAHRGLVRGGYAATIALLVAAFIAAVVGGPAVDLETDGRTEVPALAVALANVSFIIGWAFVLTGASHASGKVFLPLFVFWLFLAFIMAAAALASVLVVAVGVGLGVVMVRTGLLTRWQQRPTVEFLSWLSLTTAVVLLGYTASGRPSLFADVTYVSALYLGIAAIAFWVWLGFDAVTGAIDIGRLAVYVARRAIANRLLSVMGAFATVGLPLVLLFLVAGQDSSASSAFPSALAAWLAFAWVLTSLVGLCCVGVIVLRRWSVSAAMFAVSLDVALLALTLAFVSALWPTGIFEGLGTSHLVPPTFLFLLLASYDIAALGTRHAERDSPVAPRASRVLLYFGVVVLVLGSSMLLLNVHQDSSSFADVAHVLASFGLTAGILVLGIPYFLFVLIRRRDRMTPEPAPVTGEYPSWPTSPS